MLKLALKNGETVRIGDNVLVRFDKASENRIKNVIDAPKDVQIHRESAKKGIVQKAVAI